MVRGECCGPVIGGQFMHRPVWGECPPLPLPTWWRGRSRLYPARVNGTAARRMACQTGTVVLFRLKGEISSENLSAIQPLLTQLTGGQVSSTPEGLHVEGAMEGSDARDVNRQLLSALRRAEIRTRLRAEWTAGGTTYRFFDYVPKSERPA